jgi:hypothetical protein
MIPVFRIDKHEYPTSKKCEEYMQKNLNKLAIHR